VCVVVDFDMSFTYVLARWKRSAHDVTILADGLERLDGLIPRGQSSTLLMRVMLTVRIFFPPFRSTRYHLNVFCARHYPKMPKNCLI
jgi:hypothetical protein